MNDYSDNMIIDSNEKIYYTNWRIYGGSYMSPLEKLFGKTAQLTVLEYLIKNKGDVNYLSGIAEGTGLYHSSVARVLEPLLEHNIIIEKRLGKQMRTFVLNEDNNATKILIKFYNELKNEMGD